MPTMIVAKPTSRARTAATITTPIATTIATTLKITLHQIHHQVHLKRNHRSINGRMKKGNNLNCGGLHDRRTERG